MNKLNEIFEYYPDDQFCTLNGFDDAVIGISTDLKLIYSIPTIIEILVNENMDYEDAIEYFKYNIERSLPYIENAPILIYTEFV